MSWTLTVNGTEKTLSAWGVTDLRIERVSMAADKISFVQHGDFSSGNNFPYDATVILKNGAETRFRGTVVNPRRTGRAGANQISKSISVRALGPWHDLDRVVFEQYWKKRTGEQSASVVILNKNINGERITTGQQIREILEHAQDQGLYISYVQSDLDNLNILPPDTQETDISCAEALLNLLRWHKDVTTWFDYSSASPALRFTQRAAAPAAYYSLASGGYCNLIDISERPDLLARGVMIRYSRTNSIDGESWFDLIEDSAGFTSGLNVIKMTIQLEGSRLTTERVKVVTASVPNTDQEISDWLTSQVYWLQSPDIQSVQWTERAVILPAGSEDIPRMLIEGSVPEWTNKKAVDGMVTGRAAITYTNGNTETLTLADRQVFTDALTKNYYNYEYEPGESIPSGIAEKLYNQLSELQYDGSVTLVEEEVTGLAHPGKVLNLTGKDAKWESMRAQIQSTVEHVSAGVGLAKIIINFGPASHISAQDFVELNRANRQRKLATAGYSRRTGQAANLVDISSRTPNSNTLAKSEGGDGLPDPAAFSEHSALYVRKVFQNEGGTWEVRDSLGNPISGITVVSVAAANSPDGFRRAWVNDFTRLTDWSA